MSSDLSRSISRNPREGYGQLLAEAARRLRNASRVSVLTGAGISAESGVPTFRGEGGLWKRFRPEELANFDAFIKNPHLVQSWYSHRREILETLQPNAAHRALARLEELVEDCVIITQNIDNLHQLAGSKNVIELHGNIFGNYCIECRKRYDGPDLPQFTGDYIRCECGGLIRPDVVWFGEMLPRWECRKAEELCRRCQVLLSVGTSGVVYPAAGFPLIARENGAFVIEINPAVTEISSMMDIVIRQEAGTALPLIVEDVQ